MKKLKSRCATIQLIAPNIVENIIDDYASVEPEDLWEIKKLNEELVGGGKYGAVVDSGNMTSISKEARELVASKEFQQNTLAKAVVIRSLGHRIILKFYMQINKPHIKTKIFTEREDAIAWISEILKE